MTPAPSAAFKDYAVALAVAALCTLVCHLLATQLALTNLIMIYLLGAMFVAARGHRLAAAMYSLLAVLCFDFFFVPPRFSFTVSDSQYLLTFAVMLAVSLLISGLALRLHASAQSARLEERDVASRHELSQRLAGTRGTAATLTTATRHLAQVFDSEVIALLPGASGLLEVQESTSSDAALSDKDRSVAQWVFGSGQSAGIGASALPVASALYAPLTGSSGVVGVVRVKPRERPLLLESKNRVLLDSFCHQIALALEADSLQEKSKQAQLSASVERLRSSLLSAVSHDLKTPLAAIIGSASELLRDSALTPSPRLLLENIHVEAERLSRLVNNLLETTRLESGVSLRKEPYPLEEVLVAALESLSRQLGDRPVVSTLPSDLPAVALDPILLQQVFVNLLENALRHAAGGSPIEVSASLEGENVAVEVSDRGPGLPESDLERIFDKFHRGASGGGAGLGLAICRAVIEAHKGKISARNREGGGAVFRFSLPLKDRP